MARVIWCFVLVVAAKSDDSFIQDREVCSLLQTMVNGGKLGQSWRQPDAISSDSQEISEYIPWAHKSEGTFPLANGRIPPQLLMTGRFKSIEDLPSEVRGNLAKTLEMTPGLHVRYMNDDACRDYLKDHLGDKDMAAWYDSELHGSFKGDICRTAVLSQEGGFYTDLDFELHVPLHRLIDVNTTLMTVYAAGEGPVVLNALIAAEPKNEALVRTFAEMRQWYVKGGWTGSQGLLGPTAMQRGIMQYMQEHCPGLSMNVVSATQRSCGDGQIRFYQEELIGLGECSLAGEVVCPAVRANSYYDGVKYGVFKLGQGTQEQRLIGWPRIASCETPGCGYQGGEASLLERGTVAHATKAAHGHVSTL